MQTALDAVDTKTYEKPGFITYNPETHRFESILGIMPTEYERAIMATFKIPSRLSRFCELKRVVYCANSTAATCVLFVS